MRVLCDNIFNNNDWIASSSDDIFPIENMFDYHTLNIGRFDNKTLGTLTVLSNQNKIINSFAILNTNAYLVKIEIKNSEEEITYNINIIDRKAIYNIPPIKFLECKITFYGYKTNENNIECGYLIIGEAIDFPPHDKAKTNTVNYTHSQYFSMTNHYFRRTLPVRKYNIWKVSFSYLTNEDKEKIEKFFDDSDFLPFVLQVWKEADISSNLGEEISTAKYGVSLYGKSHYVSYDFDDWTLSALAPPSATGIKYYMKSGLYVCTNEKIDFKKGKNDLYQYSTELTFREVN